MKSYASYFNTNLPTDITSILDNGESGEPYATVSSWRLDTTLLTKHNII